MGPFRGGQAIKEEALRCGGESADALGPRAGSAAAAGELLAVHGAGKWRSAACLRPK